MTDGVWLQDILRDLNEAVEAAVGQRGVCAVMLTGGRTATRLYKAWRETPEFVRNLPHLCFYFGDERCVPPDHPESNYRLAVEALFEGELPAGVRVFPMQGDSADLEQEAQRYASLLPQRVDVLLLSMGEDGHVASLFPGSPSVLEAQRRVLSVVGAKAPHQRLTITAPVILSAEHVFVMAVGEGKRSKFEAALADREDVTSLPARLVLDRNWIFGE